MKKEKYLELIEKIKSMNLEEIDIRYDEVEEELAILFKAEKYHSVKIKNLITELELLMTEHNKKIKYLL